MGARLTFYCPGGGSPRTIYGTDIYTADSPICVAAVHAGRISWNGGVVRIKIGGFHPAYFGSFRNGVRSRRWGNYSWSYRFSGRHHGPGPVGPGPGVVTIHWGSNATAYRSMMGQTFRFYCPGGGSPRTIYGTDIYTTDSSICTAAVHAGRISWGGGTVRIMITSGQPYYAGTFRHGVSSRRWNRYGWSFVFR
ncbi:MAG: hypothetical protein KC609_13530 [Myxococcales bacterium]|nr:hypothetical protein [Myxococcales bacterium]